MTDTAWLYEKLSDSIPESSTISVSEWGRLNVKLPGSAKSASFDPDLTPWIREPLDGTELVERRKTIFIKPIQSGGSVSGEVRLCYCICMKSSGDVQYNWQIDDQADARWQKRVERIFQACPSLMKKAPRDRFKWTKGQILFPHLNFTMQGVSTDRRVASDAIKYQVNEEVHDESGWSPGRLDQAFGRLTQYWDHSAMVISNAGRKGGDLHLKFNEGTQRHWEVKCPGCGLYHVMRTKWEDSHADMGGLRYTSEGAKRGEDDYDYNKLAPTLRYEMPCGFTVYEADKVTRRRLSASGQYGEPQNTGAHVSIASYTLEAVSVHDISWIDLVMQKHTALRALKQGDAVPWQTYLRERECVFASEEDRPFFQRIVLSDRVKNRDGLPGKLFRFGALDFQKGTLAKGELPYWWAVVCDVSRNDDGKLHVLLVYEGKLLSDEDAADVMKRHEVRPRCVVVDSGHNATHVYQFCLRHGYNAIKGEDDESFAHEGGIRRIVSVPKCLFAMLNCPRTKANMDDEPRFWRYSKAAIRDRHQWLSSGGHKGNVIWEIPSDVSQDFKEHHQSEEIRERRKKGTNEMQKVWVQLKERNDLFVCMCYVAMEIDMAGLVALPSLEEKK